MKKATLVVVLLTTMLSMYGQSTLLVTQPIFSPQVFNSNKATKADWSAIPTFTTWRKTVKNASKGQPTWGYMRFADIKPYLLWNKEHWYTAYYSPDAKNLYLYNSGMTRGEKVTVRVLFPGTYYVHFKGDGILLQLNVTAKEVLINLYQNK